MDLQELSEKFYTSKAGLGRSPHTITTYKMHITDFIKWCDTNGYADSDLIGMTGADLIEEHFLHMRLDRDLSEFTISGRFRALRALYRWIERRVAPIDGGNPFTWLTQPAEPDLLPKHITFADLTLLLHSIPTHSIKGDHWLNCRDRVLIKSLFYTGMRAGEMVSLRMGDVDIPNRKLRIMRWKTGTEAYLPLARSLTDDLQLWLNAQRPAAPHDGLWPVSDGHYRPTSETMQYTTLRQLLRRRCEDAGMKRYGPHAFRHGCAAYIVQRGGDISLVKDLLGHRSIETTQQYLRFDVSRLAAGLDRIFE